MSDVPPELTDWWVLLANSTAADAVHLELAGRDVGLTYRKRHGDQSANASELSRFPIRRLVSPPHERIDIRKGTEEYREALDVTLRMWEGSPRKDMTDKEPPTEPNGIACRRTRPASRGVLMLYPLNPSASAGETAEGRPFVGFAVSFPGSQKARPVDYMVTVDAWDRWVGGSRGGDDEADEAT